MMRRFILAIIALALFAGTVRADEGMWLPSLISSRIDDMRAKGFRLSAEDIYSINRASMKDAIVKFGRGCTGELVSAEGLLFTNHHCGYSQIQSHSNVENDYLTNGFWAMSRAEELPNPGLTVTFLVRMEDVTQRVLDGIEDIDPDKNADKIKANIAKIIAEETEGTHYTAAVEPFYYGNQYFLFISEVFRDVRLVGAPPSSIGKFGGDTDNWMWPRHTGDFSIFRIYADADNKPADYSRDNVPYRPKKHFTVSTRGINEGDFTMVYGFPGSTQQYITSDAVDYVLNYSNPIKIHLRTLRLDIINAAQERDPAIRIAYAAKAATIANSWKKWQGESLGLARLGTIAKKQLLESDFNRWAAENPEYSDVLSRLQEEYSALLPYAIARDYYTEAIRGVEFIPASERFTALKSKEAGQLSASLSDFFKDYSPEIDCDISKVLLAEYIGNSDPQFIPQMISEKIREHGSIERYIDWIFDNSFVVSLDKAIALAASEEEIAEVMDADPAVELQKAFVEMYREKISPVVSQRNRNITALYSTYVRGLMNFDPGKDYFPDANLTLRVAYGNVGGYRLQDGITHLPVSTIDGIIQKDDPQVYDYDIPQRLRDIYLTRDFGRWEVNGTVPVCFLATNHTTGGNSGSPVLNGRGELIGINFDRTWLSTMSDIEFDPQMCRNIAIDIRYLLFVVDKIGNASYLFDEMNIVDSNSL